MSAGAKVVAVNGRRWSSPGLRQAIRETKTGPHAIELLAENGEFFTTHRLEYDGGERYPRLTPVAGAPDVLSAIIKPLAPPAP